MGLGKAIGSAAGAALAGVAAHDVLQKRHAILRNFPVVGHFRYLLEEVGPELRQYIVTSNDEERPFSRDQRRWVYASSKKEINTFGFGTDNDLENVEGLLVLKQVAFPAAPPSTFAAGSRYSGGLPVVPLRGGPVGNGDCLMTSRLGIDSRSLSVPNPKVLISFFDEA